VTISPEKIYYGKKKNIPLYSSAQTLYGV